MDCSYLLRVGQIFPLCRFLDFLSDCRNEVLTVARLPDVPWQRGDL